MKDLRFKQELMDEFNDLSEQQIKEVLDYVYFVKARLTLDPSQMYF